MDDEIGKLRRSNKMYLFICFIAIVCMCIYAFLYCFYENRYESCINFDNGTDKAYCNPYYGTGDYNFNCTDFKVNSTGNWCDGVLICEN